MNEQKRVVIATDASCDPSYHISTWACIILYDGIQIKRSGVFKEYYKRTHEAETYAMINALVVASQEVPRWKSRKVIIYGEVDHALRPIVTKTGEFKKKDFRRSQALNDIALPILSRAGEWRFDKVQAHATNWIGKEGPTLNRACDLQARQELREIREQILAL